MHFPLAALAVTAVVSSGVYYSIPVGSGGAGSEPTSAAIAAPLETVSPDLEVPILRAGISPEFLAASGASSGAVNTVINAVAEEFGDLSALEAADSAFTAARQAHADLERLVKSGLGDEGDATALAAAVTTMNSAKSALDTLLAGARAAGVAELTTPQQATYTSLCANRDRRMPTEFLVLDLDSADWIKLRDALNDEKAAPKLGLDPNAELQSFLSAKRADSAVAAAKTSLDANLTAIQTAWTASFAD